MKKQGINFLISVFELTIPLPGDNLIGSTVTFHLIPENSLQKTNEGDTDE